MYMCIYILHTVVYYTMIARNMFETTGTMTPCLHRSWSLGSRHQPGTPGRRHER